jgi:D-alanine-D-alanine ligase
LARGAGLPVLDWVEVERAAWEADRAAVLAKLDRLAAGVPDGRLIAKPACLGSSVGMGIAHHPAERGAIVEGALAHDARVIVEPCLDRPRELEMGVLGNTATGLRLLARAR